MGLFGGGSPPINLRSESRYIGCVELSDQLFTITSQRMCCPLQSMYGEEIVDLRHCRETPCKDPPLQCKCTSHKSFVIQELCIKIDLKLLVYTLPVGLVNSRGEGMSW